MTGTVELVIVERGGMRFGVPARRIIEIGELPAAARASQLQQQLGQPPFAEGERCFGLAVDVPGGRAVVPVAGQVTIKEVPDAEIVPLPAIMVGVAPVSAVVFGEGAPVLVLDVDAMVEHARAVS